MFATHLLGASVMAAPAALAISKILFPETTEPETKGTVKVKIEKNASNVIEAAAGGASDGFNAGIKCWCNANCICCFNSTGKLWFAMGWEILRVGIKI